MNRKLIRLIKFNLKKEKILQRLAFAVLIVNNIKTYYKKKLSINKKSNLLKEIKIQFTIEIHPFRVIN